MDDDRPAYPALKEIFDRARLASIADAAAGIASGFDRDRFMAVATRDLDDLGIMQRMRQTAVALEAALATPFPKAAGLLRALAPRIDHGFAAIALCEYVTLFGRDHFDLAMETLHDLTRHGSAEFAVRHFLAADFDRTLAVMRRWTADPDEHVRRLASEGSRPRLPWSFRLERAVADPSLTFPIPEALRGDPSAYVRKSAANHLNDIAKDHPDWLLNRLAAWPPGAVEERWVVRHALRILVKKGDPRALRLIGATGAAEVRVEGFSATPTRLKLGERLTIAARLVSTGGERQRLVVDYAIHYVKKNGATSRKVFKLREVDLAPGAAWKASTSQVVRDFTTRSHNAGFHRVELMVNGAVLAESGFELVT
ncbi:MAG TPA: DNA alkylation repair protein [Rhizobiales bacterium]|nr:DNA alkylation repair protein [Hyphomicrobiales bacterium]